MPAESPIVVFSHLRWEFVYQRPQHVLSRLAADRRIIFIEEPLRAEDGRTRWERSTPAPNVFVYRPFTPLEAGSFTAEQMPYLVPMLEDLLRTEEVTSCVAWLYTPMALPLARTLQPEAVVYDCMDQLAAFAGAPPELIRHEAELLEWADVVFTGGPSLYNAKKDAHPNVHCFPSSVDAAHFRQALTIQEAPDQREIARPRLGYYGVIDERLDPALLSALADAHPDWQIIMVGPVVKIDPAGLPARDNVHYFGQRSYQELPAYLAGWDVCLMPFALNEATKYISPTKVLEYMAAERPIVSTPITDIAVPYGHIVYLGTTPQEFVTACEQALGATKAEMALHLNAMRDVLALTSWDATAAAMAALIREAVTQHRNRNERLEGLQV
jgi:UDP-galactopyranose mutase